MVQASTGFGFAVVGAPLLLFFMEPKAVVTLMVFGALLLNLLVIRQTWGQADLRSIGPMFIASLLGIIPGVYILKIVDPSVLKLAIGLIILVVAGAMAADYAVTIRRERLATVVVGIVSGFMGGATSLSGPPVALFLMNQRQDKEAFRALLVRYFCLGNIATLGTMAMLGTLELEVVRQGAYALPGIMAGVWLGDKVFRAVSPVMFRRVALAIVFLCGVLSVAGELPKYF